MSPITVNFYEKKMTQALCSFSLYLRNIPIKDRCTVKLGRRRPFIIFLCLFAMVGMSLLTFAPYMINLIGIESALIVAIIGSQMMDWGLDATETPFRAYT